MSEAVEVILPSHLSSLARLEGSTVRLDVAGPVTQRAVLDALEARFPMLTGTVRDRGTAQRRAFVHRRETEAPYAQIVSGVLELVDLEILDGDEGEIEPGVRWIRTPGHSDGLISLLVDTDDGLTVIASDCVGPLPEYFDQMDLPEDFGPEREELLEQWRRIRELDPAVVIPGHNPPVRLR